MHFTLVSDGLAFPEGPVILADGSVLVVEIRSGRLTRVAPDGAKTVVAELGGGPNGAAIGPDGAVYVCNNGGLEFFDAAPDLAVPGHAPHDYVSGSIQRIDLATGAVTTLYDACDGRPLRGPNDIVFDADGGFWFSDFGKARGRDADRGSLFYATTDGAHIVEAARGLNGPNGVGLSPGGDRVYVAESYTGRLLAWDVASPGTLKSPLPEVVEATKGHFDSLATLADGSIAVAAIGQGVCTVAADGSGHEYVEMPDRFVTNIAFGGDDLRTAYLTFSGSGRLVSCAWDRPGLQLAF
jgi:gluconolactonase